MGQYFLIKIVKSLYFKAVLKAKFFSKNLKCLHFMIIEILLGLAKFNSLYSIFFSSMEVHIIYVEKNIQELFKKYVQE